MQIGGFRVQRTGVQGTDRRQMFISYGDNEEHEYSVMKHGFMPALHWTTHLDSTECIYCVFCVIPVLIGAGEQKRESRKKKHNGAKISLTGSNR